MKSTNPTNQSLFAQQLSYIMRYFYNQAQWANLLGINRSSITHWFRDTTIPSKEHMVFIKNIIEEEDNAEINELFEELCHTSLIKLTFNYEKFKARNLYDYMAGVTLDRINFQLESLNIDSKMKDKFYDQISLFINIFSNLADDERDILFKSLIKLKEVNSTTVSRHKRKKLLDSIYTLIDKNPEGSVYAIEETEPLQWEDVPAHKYYQEVNEIFSSEGNYILNRERLVKILLTQISHPKQYRPKRKQIASVIEHNYTYKNNAKKVSKKDI